MNAFYLLPIIFPTIISTPLVTNTKICQLGKFLIILSSLQKKFEFLRPILKKLDNANFRKS